MTTQILNFRKTDHFLYSQWGRKIDDQVLYKVLPFVECTKCCKDVIIVRPTFLRRKGINAKSNESLVIIANRNILVTCYWCEHADYLYSKESYAHFQELIK